MFALVYDGVVYFIVHASFYPGVTGQSRPYTPAQNIPHTIYEVQ